jgi:hypothetical protein
MLWYIAMVVIVIGGIGLAAYSRNERLHPSTVGPTASDNWQVAFAVDVCGTLQPNLPANSNLSKVGIRTYGSGLINVNPGALSSGASAFEGAKATLGKFASSYPSFQLTSTSLKLPTKGARTWKNGDACTGPLKGKGTLEAEVWSSPTATGHIVTDVTTIHLSNQEMITLAFVPAGSSIPKPPSASALTGSTSTTTTAAPSSTTTTKAGSTTTSAPSTSTTAASTSTTTKG